MPDSRNLPRRFYKAVEVAERPDGFAVLLDGRPLKTPAKRSLTLPTRALAELVAAEWAAQGDYIDPHTMLATRLVNVALDRVPDARAATADEVARYVETDLVCHIADSDLELARREEAVWAPLRAWAQAELGLALTPVAGLRAAAQPPSSLAAARSHAAALDDLSLVALAHATALLGSAVLGFALQKGRLDAEAAFAASRIDETCQQELWGVDAEEAERAARLLDELRVVERVMRGTAKTAH